ncbi:MAG: hypothetical protein AAGD96_31025, partial [Chloroflexota bacterium]
MSTIRRNCTNPHKGGSLSQEKLTELVLEHDPSLVISKSLVSSWENGRRSISVERRDLLLAIIIVFAQCGGLNETEEANNFLQLGKYAPLDKEETDQVPHSSFQWIGEGTAPLEDNQENLTITNFIQILQEQSDDNKKLRNIINKLETERKEAITNISSTQRKLLEIIPYHPTALDDIFALVYTHVDREEDMRLKEVNLRLHELRYLGLINRTRDSNHRWLYWREFQRSLFLEHERQSAIKNISDTQTAILELIPLTPIPLDEIFSLVYMHVDPDEKIRIKEINLR